MEKRKAPDLSGRFSGLADYLVLYIVTPDTGNKETFCEKNFRFTSCICFFVGFDSASNGGRQRIQDICSQRCSGISFSSHGRG